VTGGEKGEKGETDVAWQPPRVLRHTAKEIENPENSDGEKGKLLREETPQGKEGRKERYTWGSWIKKRDRKRGRRDKKGREKS